MENTVKLSSCSKILHLHKKIMTTIGINCCYVCMRETGCCQEGVYYLLIWEFPSSIKGKIIWTNKLTNRQTDRQTNRQTYWSIIEGYLWKCENVIFMNKFIRVFEIIPEFYFPHINTCLTVYSIEYILVYSIYCVLFFTIPSCCVLYTWWWWWWWWSLTFLVFNSWLTCLPIHSPFAVLRSTRARQRILYNTDSH